MSQADRSKHTQESTEQPDRVEGRPEDAWIDAYRRGDERAFEQFHEQYFQKLVYYLRFCAFEVSLDVAEDLATDVEVKVARGIRCFREDSDFRGWLYAIARNVKVDHGRHLNRRVREVPLDNLSLNERSGDPVPYALVLVRECLAKLSVEDREVLMLTIVEGMTCREVAKILGVKDSTIEFRKARAFERLRSLLGTDTDPCFEPTRGVL